MRPLLQFVLFLALGCPLLVAACGGEAPHVPNLMAPLCGRAVVEVISTGANACAQLRANDPDTAFERPGEDCPSTACVRLAPGETVYVTVRIAAGENANWLHAYGDCADIPECPEDFIAGVPDSVRSGGDVCSPAARDADVVGAVLVARSGDCAAPDLINLGTGPDGCETTAAEWSQDGCGLAAAYRCPTYEAKHNTVVGQDGTVTGVYTRWDGSCAASWDVTAAL